MSVFPLYLDGAESGTLTTQNDGLRLHLIAQSKAKDGIFRAYAVSGGERLLIGVMIPDGGVMTARKTYNLSALGGFSPNSVTHAVAATEAEGQTPSSGWARVSNPASLFTDIVVRKSLDASLECWIKASPPGLLLAIPWRAGMRFPLPAVFCLCSVETIGGRQYAVFRCGDDGMPSLKA